MFSCGSKSHLNVATIGPAGGGKTSLTLAITKVLAAEGIAKALALDDLDNTPEEKAAGHTIDTARVEYMTNKRHYAHTDCPGVLKYVKNLCAGVSQADAAILVVNANDANLPAAREHIVLAVQANVSKFVVFLNKVDLVDSEEQLQLLEVRLSDMFLDLDLTPMAIVRGSAVAAIEGTNEEIGKKAVLEVLSLLDSIPDPQRDVLFPFVMAVKDVFPAQEVGIKVIGVINSGVVRAGDEVEIVGVKPTTITATVTGVESFKRSLTHGQAGDNVELLIAGLTRDAVERGQVICKPGTKAHKKFTARMYILSKEEGGRAKPFRTNYKPQFFIRTADTSGTITLPEGTEMVMPGATVTVTVELLRPIAFPPHQRFAVRDGDRTVGAGVVDKIIA